MLESAPNSRTVGGDELAVGFRGHSLVRRIRLAHRVHKGGAA
jgi:hypothetical protein